MDSPDIRFVLGATSPPGNIGAVGRALGAGVRRRAPGAHQRGARGGACVDSLTAHPRLPVTESRHGGAAGGVRAVPGRRRRCGGERTGPAAARGRAGNGAPVRALRAGAGGDRVSRPHPERHALAGTHPALPAARRARSERGQHPARHPHGGTEPAPPRRGAASITAAGPLYLDYAATTPVDPAVAAAMSGCLTAGREAGHPSSAHALGAAAAARIAAARAQLAALLGAAAEEIVFTSGATESDNLAILG